MKSARTVVVDGQARRVTDMLSSGPGRPIHTYVLTYGEYVYEIAGQWWLQAPGQFKRAVTVEA